MSLPTLLSRQALETLDNGKPYVISYLVDLDMVLKCLRYVLCLAIEKREGAMLGGRTRRMQRLTRTGTCQPSRLTVRISPLSVLLCPELCVIISMSLELAIYLRDLMCWSLVVPGFWQPFLSSILVSAFSHLDWLKARQLFACESHAPHFLLSCYV